MCVRDRLCGESGCLPAVVVAVRSNWMTAKGADEMSGICTSLASFGKDSTARAISGLLHGSRHKGPDDAAERLDCNLVNA